MTRRLCAVVVCALLLLAAFALDAPITAAWDDAEDGMKSVSVRQYEAMLRQFAGTATSPSTWGDANGVRWVIEAIDSAKQSMTALGRDNSLAMGALDRARAAATDFMNAVDNVSMTTLIIVTSQEGYRQTTTYETVTKPYKDIYPNMPSFTPSNPPRWASLGSATDYAGLTYSKLRPDMTVSPAQFILPGDGGAYLWESGWGHGWDSGFPLKLDTAKTKYDEMLSAIMDAVTAENYALSRLADWAEFLDIDEVMADEYQRVSDYSAAPRDLANAAGGKITKLKGETDYSYLVAKSEGDMSTSNQGRATVSVNAGSSVAVQAVSLLGRSSAAPNFGLSLSVLAYENFLRAFRDNTDNRFGVVLALDNLSAEGIQSARDNQLDEVTEEITYRVNLLLSALKAAFPDVFKEIDLSVVIGQDPLYGTTDVPAVILSTATNRHTVSSESYSAAAEEKEDIFGIVSTLLQGGTPPTHSRYPSALVMDNRLKLAEKCLDDTLRGLGRLYGVVSGTGTAGTVKGWLFYLDNYKPHLLELLEDYENRVALLSEGDNTFRDILTTARANFNAATSDNENIRNGYRMLRWSDFSSEFYSVYAYFGPIQLTYNWKEHERARLSWAGELIQALGYIGDNMLYENTIHASLSEILRRVDANYNTWQRLTEAENRNAYKLLMVKDLYTLQKGNDNLKKLLDTKAALRAEKITEFYISKANEKYRLAAALRRDLLARGYIASAKTIKDSLLTPWEADLRGLLQYFGAGSYFSPDLGLLGDLDHLSLKAASLASIRSTCEGITDGWSTFLTNHPEILQLLYQTATEDVMVGDVKMDQPVTFHRDLYATQRLEGVASTDLVEYATILPSDATVAGVYKYVGAENKGGYYYTLTSTGGLPTVSVYVPVLDNLAQGGAPSEFRRVVYTRVLVENEYYTQQQGDFVYDSTSSSYTGVGFSRTYHLTSVVGNYSTVYADFVISSSTALTSTVEVPPSGTATIVIYGAVTSSGGRMTVPVKISGFTPGQAHDVTVLWKEPAYHENVDAVAAAWDTAVQEGVVYLRVYENHMFVSDTAMPLVSVPISMVLGDSAVQVGVSGTAVTAGSVETTLTSDNRHTLLRWRLDNLAPLGRVLNTVVYQTKDPENTMKSLGVYVEFLRQQAENLRLAAENLLGATLTAIRGVEGEGHVWKALGDGARDNSIGPPPDNSYWGPAIQYYRKAQVLYENAKTQSSRVWEAANTNQSLLSALSSKAQGAQELGALMATYSPLASRGAVLQSEAAAAGVSKDNYIAAVSVAQSAADVTAASSILSDAVARMTTAWGNAKTELCSHATTVSTGAGTQRTAAEAVRTMLNGLGISTTALTAKINLLGQDITAISGLMYSENLVALTSAVITCASDITATIQTSNQVASSAAVTVRQALINQVAAIGQARDNAIAIAGRLPNMVAMSAAARQRLGANADAYAERAAGTPGFVTQDGIDELVSRAATENTYVTQAQGIKTSLLAHYDAENYVAFITSYQSKQAELSGLMTSITSGTLAATYIADLKAACLSALTTLRTNLDALSAAVETAAGAGHDMSEQKAFLTSAADRYAALTTETNKSYPAAADVVAEASYLSDRAAAYQANVPAVVEIPGGEMPKGLLAVLAVVVVGLLGVLIMSKRRGVSPLAIVKAALMWPVDKLRRGKKKAEEGETREVEERKPEEEGGAKEEKRKEPEEKGKKKDITLLEDLG